MSKFLLLKYKLTHGGDMSISRTFDVSALRQGFIIDIEQNYYSEVFSLYGFYFELIAEKASNNKFQFVIQVTLFLMDFISQNACIKIFFPFIYKSV